MEISGWALEAKKTAYYLIYDLEFMICDLSADRQV